MTESPSQLPCHECAYDLAGLGQPGSRVMCPECGHEQSIGALPEKSVEWKGMLLATASPWLLLPFVLCAGPIGLLAPALFSLLVAIGYSGLFKPTIQSSTVRQIAAATGIWLAVGLTVIGVPLFIILMLTAFK